MKKFILAIALTLSAASAFAHPNDSDSVFHLPVRTKMKVTNDINLLPGTVMVWLKQGETVKTAVNVEYIKAGGTVCWLSFYEISDDDRVVPAGSEYEIISPVEVKVHDFGSSNVQTTVRFKMNSKTIKWVQCTTGGFVEGFTIGRLRGALKANFSLSVAPPIAVR